MAVGEMAVIIPVHFSHMCTIDCEHLPWERLGQKTRVETIFTTVSELPVTAPPPPPPLNIVLHVNVGRNLCRQPKRKPNL